MNIFWLSDDFGVSASYYSDQHMKIILEILQCLFAVHHLIQKKTNDDTWTNGLCKIYKATHTAHPIVKWISQCRQNYVTALQMGLALCIEFRQRRNKPHACEKIMRQLPIPSIFYPESYKDTTVFAEIGIPHGCTPVPLCMPAEYFRITFGKFNLIESYRAYYANTKLSFKNGKLATFNKIPEFIVVEALCDLVN